MRLHKCRVYTCKIRETSSKKYNIDEYYRIDIHNHKKLISFYIRTCNNRGSKMPFSLFSSNIIKYVSLYPRSIYINDCKKSVCELTFYKYIEIYPNIIKLFESKDEYSIRIGLEILKQQLELNIQ